MNHYSIEAALIECFLVLDKSSKDSYTLELIGDAYSIIGKKNKVAILIQKHMDSARKTLV
jgi:hypothetical protein